MLAPSPATSLQTTSQSDKNDSFIQLRTIVTVRYSSLFQSVFRGTLNLRVLPAASMGSTKSNRETGTKRHLWPLDAFFGLLVRPNWSGRCPELLWGSLQWQQRSTRPSSLPAPFPRTSSPLSPFDLKGELNPKIKLDLNDSFCTLINKYNPHIF